MTNLNLSEFKEERRNKICSSPIFSRQLTLQSEDLEKIFSQYWYPLNYFPNFLATLVIQMPNIEDKSRIARVLSEELGNGTTSESHENAYLEAMDILNLEREKVVDTGMTHQTEALMDGYRSCETNRLKALGFFLSTEIADLWIVSNLGRIMFQSLEERQTIKWVDLHVKQEPGHVNDAADCLSSILSNSAEVEKVILYANECAFLWDNFFLGISYQLSHQRIACEQVG